MNGSYDQALHRQEIFHHEHILGILGELSEKAAPPCPPNFQSVIDKKIQEIWAETEKLKESYNLKYIPHAARGSES